MKVNIKELIEYFDIKENTDYGDTTATISIVGEDLCAAIFKHYCEQERKSILSIIDPNFLIPTTMKKIGRRLDRWIFEKQKGKNILYQTEIKNWCSRAIGGVNIPIDSKKEIIDELAEINWIRHLQDIQSKEPNGLNKVLVNMVNNKKLDITDTYEKEPLLILWHAAKPKEEKNFFFKYNIPKKYFYYDYLWVFSCSLYLRYLYAIGNTDIVVDMPNVNRRLKQLINIFKI